MAKYLKFFGLIICFGGVWPFLWAVPHDNWFAALALFCAFIGSGIVNGFRDYIYRPQGIDGNSQIVINQTWMMLILGTACNALFANLV